LIDDIKLNIEIINNNNINNGINEIIYGNPSKEKYKAVVLGDRKVGSKTSFMNVLIKDIFDLSIESTICASFSFKEIILKNGNEIIIEIWDISGQEKYRKLIPIFIQNSDCIVLGYDITRKELYENIKSNWFPTSKEFSGANLFYLIGNKIDLYEQEEVTEFDAREYAESNNMRFFQISCMNRTRIKEFLDDITDELIKI